MRTGRRLTLRKEALTDLTPAEMDVVAGAQQQTFYCPYSALQCLTKVTACANLSAALQDCPF
ncbi:MAG: hypothetical protein QOE45_3083 [Frankiaceae bacterium]|jgi:hypothetical protein|nr:hypothetical protein [Frankiaceae bacterium]